MKKLIATAALGTLLVAGFLFAQEQQSDVAMDVEPSILSINNTGFFY